MRRLLRATGQLALVGAAGCADPAGVDPDGGELTPGRDANGKVSSGDTAFYAYRAGPSEVFRGQVKAVSGSVTLTIRDPAGQPVVPPATAVYAAPIVGEARTAEVIPPRETRYTLVVVGAGDFRVQVLGSESAPERASPHLTSAVAVEESIDGAFDADEFFLHGSVGDILIAYVQALDAGNPDRLNLEVRSPAGLVVAHRSSMGRDPELETQATEWIAVDSAGPWRFRVTGPYRGNYRLMVRIVDPAPEAVPPAAPDNILITGERIDHVGDIDVFTIAAPPGTVYNVMLRTVGEAADSVRLEVMDMEAASPIRAVISGGQDSLYSDRATGRFAIGPGAKASLRVLPYGRTRAAYELYAYRIDPAPEGPVAELVLGDSLREAVALPGDIDEFLLTLPMADTVILVLTATALRPFPAGLYSLEGAVRGAAGEVLGVMRAEGSARATTGPMPLEPGQYLVRIDALSDQIDGFRGGYNLGAYRMRGAPETRAGGISIGEIVTESIEPAGDVDTWEVLANRGDHLDVRLQLLAEAPFPGEVSVLVTMAGGLRPVAAAYTSGPAPDLEQVGTRRITITETGVYQVAVGSINGANEAFEPGRYRLVVRRVPSGPEHHAESLFPGDTVVDEGIETLGDVDEFVMHGPPGGELLVFATAGPGIEGLSIEVVDPVSRSIVRSANSFGFRQSLGRIPVPDAGRLILRLTEPRWPEPIVDAFRRTGPYRLEVAALDRVPEQQPALFAIGDTVSGESIAPSGDIDEFQVMAVAGDRLVALLDTPLGMAPPGILLQVLEPGSSTALAAVASYLPSTAFGDVRSAAFTVPASGTYLVRIQGIDEYNAASGPYRFMLRRQ